MQNGSLPSNQQLQDFSSQSNKCVTWKQVCLFVRRVENFLSVSVVKIYFFDSPGSVYQPLIMKWILKQNSDDILYTKCGMNIMPCT